MKWKHEKLGIVQGVLLREWCGARGSKWIDVELTTPISLWYMEQGDRVRVIRQAGCVMGFKKTFIKELPEPDRQSSKQELKPNNNDPKAEQS